MAWTGFFFFFFLGHIYPGNRDICNTYKTILFEKNCRVLEHTKYFFLCSCKKIEDEGKAEETESV